MRRALKAAFAGEVGKDVVSRTWRKVKGDWNASNARSLTDEPIIRLILDGTQVVHVRLDKKATSISLLVALGVRANGQKVLLAIKNMGGESEAAWRALLDDLVKRGLKTPELVIVDGAPGLDKALAVSSRSQSTMSSSYQEMLTHVPLLAHGSAANMLIIDAGDGGVLPRRRTHRGRQQYSGTHHASDRTRQKKSSFRRQSPRRRNLGDLVVAHQHLQTQ